MVWPVAIMKQHFKGDLLCLLYFLPVCILHGFYFNYFIPNLSFIICTNRFATTR